MPTADRPTTPTRPSAALPASPSYARIEAEFDAYQDFSMSRAGITFIQRERLILAGLGLTGEAGEVADLVKKTIYHGQEIDVEKLILEAGDVLWYIAYLADALGVPLSRIAAANRDKLLARYPDGFSTHHAAARLDEARAEGRERGAA